MADTPRTALALCAGVGGLELGLQCVWPDMRVVGYVEREAYAASVLLARMEDKGLEPAPIWCGNLEDADYRGFQGVDLVCAGFPCQPWSVAGKREGAEDERWLWDSLVECFRVVQPRWIVLENVPGLLSGGVGPVCRDLAALGFDAEWGLLRADAVGAAHRRERWFCVAYAGRRAVREHNGIGWQQEAASGADSGGVAYADRVQRRPDSRGPDAGADGRHDVGRGSTGLEHAPSGGRGVERPTPQPGHGRHADSADPTVADAELARRTPTGSGRSLDAGGEPEQGSSDMADAVRDGRQGPRIESGHATEPHACDHVFAPGPDRLDLWARVLSETPEVEPSFCRMADGMADRLDGRADRLRAIGNGVVPLQAAVAVRLLVDRLGE